MTFISHLSFMFVLSIKKIFIFISEFGETCNVLYYYLLFAVGPFRRRVMDLIPNTTGYSPRYVWLRVHFESKLPILMQLWCIVKSGSLRKRVLCVRTRYGKPELMAKTVHLQPAQ